MSSKEEGGRWSLGVPCAKRSQNILITFSFIVIRLGYYGIWWSIFGIQWVIFASIRETLLGWHDPFVGRRHMKAWRAGFFMYFLDYLEGKN